MKDIYVTTGIIGSLRVTVKGNTDTVYFNTLQDGCMGILLVFNDKAKAEKFARDRDFEVQEIEYGGTKATNWQQRAYGEDE